MTGAIELAKQRIEEYVRVCYNRQERLDTLKLRRLEDELVLTVRAFKEPF